MKYNNDFLFLGESAIVLENVKCMSIHLLESMADKLHFRSFLVQKSVRFFWLYA